MSRHPTATPDPHHVTLDVAQTTGPSKSGGRVSLGIDAVINTTGTLHGQDMHGAHVSGSAALYAACESAGVRHVVLFSAIGTDRDARSYWHHTARSGSPPAQAGRLR